jgi:hypothetical protein
MEMVFSRGHGIISSLITWATNSDVSHASIHFNGGDEKWMVESTGKYGVYPGWWDTFVKHTTVKYRFLVVNIDEKMMNDAVDEALDEMIGQGYDFIGVIVFGIKLAIKKIFGKDIKRNALGSEKVMFCSEFMLCVAMKIKAKTGTEIYHGVPDRTSPEDLKAQSFNNPYLKQVV